MGLIRRLAIAAMLTMVLTACVYPAAASSTNDIRISQAYVELPQITAYFTINDAAGNAVPNVNPTDIKAVLGTHAQSVSSVKTFAESGEGVAYVFLVDISKSLHQGQFVQIQAALQQWSAELGAKDRVAIMTFGTTVSIVQDFTADKEVLKKKISGLAMTDENTQLHRGLVQAIETARQINPDLPKRRVIITLTDGEDDFAGGMTKDEVLESLRVDRIPIYAIGFAEPPISEKNEASFKVLGEFARMSGGAYFQAGAKPLADMYKDMHKQICSGYVAVLATTAAGDGSIARLQLTYQTNGQTFTDGLDLRLTAAAAQPPPATPPTAETPKSTWEKVMDQPLYIKILAGAAIVLAGGGIIVLIIYRSRKGKRRAAELGSAPASPIVQEQPDPGPLPVADPLLMNVLQPPQITLAGGLSVAPPQPERNPLSLAITLTVLGSSDRKQYHIDDSNGKITIGRRSGNTVVIAQDVEVSAKHCQLWFENQELMIGDTGSTNGTYVNGVAIKDRHRLQHDDVIMIGRTELRLSIGQHL